MDTKIGNAFASQVEISNEKTTFVRYFVVVVVAVVIRRIILFYFSRLLLFSVMNERVPI